MYFEDQIARGRTVEEARGDIESVEKKILQIQLACEDDLHCEEVVFLDRGLPDVLTFYRWEGLNPNRLLQQCFRYCYAAVYVLDPLPVVRDGIRIEGEDLREFLNTWLPRDYAALGYDVGRIPVLPREERLDWLVAKLKHRGLM